MMHSSTAMSAWEVVWSFVLFPGRFVTTSRPMKELTRHRLPLAGRAVNRDLAARLSPNHRMQYGCATPHRLSDRSLGNLSSSSIRPVSTIGGVACQDCMPLGIVTSLPTGSSASLMHSSLMPGGLLGSLQMRTGARRKGRGVSAASSPAAPWGGDCKNRKAAHPLQALGSAWHAQRGVRRRIEVESGRDRLHFTIEGLMTCIRS